MDASKVGGSIDIDVKMSFVIIVGVHDALCASVQKIYSVSMELFVFKRKIRTIVYRLVTVYMFQGKLFILCQMLARKIAFTISGRVKVQLNFECNNTIIDDYQGIWKQRHCDEGSLDVSVYDTKATSRWSCKASQRNLFDFPTFSCCNSCPYFLVVHCFQLSQLFTRYVTDIVFLAKRKKLVIPEKQPEAFYPVSIVYCFANCNNYFVFSHQVPIYSWFQLHDLFLLTRRCTSHTHQF